MSLKNKYLSIYSVLLAFSLILGYIDNLFPIFFMGIRVKLGLSNIVSFVGMIFFNMWIIFFISILRVTILSLLNGSIYYYIISVFSCIFSHICMIFLINLLKIKKNKNNYFIYFTNIMASMMHNTTQIIVLYFLIGTVQILYLVITFLFISILTGIFTSSIDILLIKSKFFNTIT